MTKDDFSDYIVTEDGHIFKKSGEEVKQFKSNKYMQCLLYDNNHIRHVLGVHTVIAMFLYKNYKSGHVVHHKDGDTHNNSIENLESMYRKDHSKMHNKNNLNLANYVRIHGPANKGKKMSDEFCKKCSESAKLRHQRKNAIIYEN